MIPYLDPVDGKWRIRGHESHHFTSEADAEAAIDFAFDHAMELLETDRRYRRASERGQAKQAELA